jgi:FkbM family methyltransferase
MFLKNHKKTFNNICEHNGLCISFDDNSSGLQVLQNIFVDREYADYFPFYQDAVIVDIGAHYGYFSLFADVNSGPNARVFSFEPDPKNYAVLNKNISSQGSKKIKVFPFAIGGKNRTASLHLGHSTNSSLIEDYQLLSKEHSSTSVDVRALDEVLTELNIDKIDFLKIDCEGAEYEIIAQSSDDSLKKASIISMEFHDMKNVNQTAQTLISRLTSLGFHVVKFQYERTNYGLNYGKLIFQK